MLNISDLRSLIFKLCNVTFCTSYIHSFPKLPKSYSNKKMRLFISCFQLNFVHLYKLSEQSEEAQRILHRYQLVTYYSVTYSLQLDYKQFITNPLFYIKRAATFLRKDAPF